MSILVNIKQNPKNLKKIGLKFIKKIATAENLCFGVLNEACSFDEYEGGEDIRNQLLILFSRKSYGRGMSLTIDDNYNLELVLNFPATQTDINNFYKIIKNICKKLKTETFLQEETKYKVDKYKTKKIFRDIAHEKLESKVSDKKKLGFPVPIRVWMKDDDVYMTIKNRFNGASKFFKVDKIIKLLDDHRAGKADNSRKIWTIYIFLLWYDVYFGGAK